MGSPGEQAGYELVIGHHSTPGGNSAKTFVSILAFTSITHFPIFGEISNIKYLDGKWGGREAGGVITRRGINKGYEYAKGPSIRDGAAHF